MEDHYLSRLSKFYELTINERQKILMNKFGITKDQISSCSPSDGLNFNCANKMIENCFGIFGLPLGLAVNFLIDNKSVVIPMVIEEPSVIAACSSAAALIGSAGGFKTTVDDPIMIGQVQLSELVNIDETISIIKKKKNNLIIFANNLCKNMVKRGGGVNNLNIKRLNPTSGRLSRFDSKDPMLIIEFSVNCCDAMGANIINKIAEGLGKEIFKLTSCEVDLQILTNLSDKRIANSRCEISLELLSSNKLINNGIKIAKKIVNAFRFAIRDPYRAATHNKGILNGIDSIAIATGNDWRAIEAGAHAFAAKDGKYTSLTEYEINKSTNKLECSITLPLAVGVLGGSINTHPVVQSNLSILGSFGKSSKKLAGLMASAGLAQNLGALRTMCSDGIQGGHMKLHLRKNNK